jgi:hypothetical protein
LDWHHKLHRWAQSKVAAAIHLELPGFAATQAERQKAIATQESNGADRPMCLFALGVGVVQRENQLVAALHGGVDHLFVHGRDSYRPKY